MKRGYMAMTLKTSLCKQIRQDTRHQMWLPILSGIVYLFGLIGLIMALQHLSITLAEKHNTAVILEAEVPTLLGKGNPLLMLVAVVGGVFCGIAMFSYVFCRSETDFYHKLPISRTRLFLTRYLEGVLYYIVPSFLFTVLSYGLCVFFSLASKALPLIMLKAYLNNLIIFLLVYHTALLATMLCGQILVAQSAFLVLMLYFLVLAHLVPAYISSYNETYVYSISGIWYWLSLLSPAKLVLEFQNLHLAPWRLLYALLIAGAALCLYRIRPSEKSGDSLVFSKTRPFIRILISVPLALYGGLGFLTAAPGNADLWQIIGTLLTLLLVHGCIETIFDQNIKSALGHRISLLGCMAFCLIFSIVFQTNALKLDDRLPKRSTLTSVTFQAAFDWEVEYFDLQGNGYLGNTSDYLIDHAVLTGNNIDLVYDLVDGSAVSYTPDMKYPHPVYVNFYNRFGIAEKRLFYIDKDASAKYMSAIFNTEEFKTTYYQLLTLPDEKFTSMSVLDDGDSVLVRGDNGSEYFNAADTKAFLAIYREELLNLSYEDVTAFPIGSVRLSSSSLWDLSYPLYASMTRSIRYLEEAGISFKAYFEEDIALKIITFSGSENTALQNTAAKVQSLFTDDEEAMGSLLNVTYIRDAKEIQKLLPYLTGISYTSASPNIYALTDRLAAFHPSVFVMVIDDASSYKEDSLLASASGTYYLISKDLDLSKLPRA